MEGTPLGPGWATQKVISQCAAMEHGVGPWHRQTKNWARFCQVLQSDRAARCRLAACSRASAVPVLVPVPVPVLHDTAHGGRSRHCHCHCHLPACRHGRSVPKAGLQLQQQQQLASGLWPSACRSVHSALPVNAGQSKAKLEYLVSLLLFLPLVFRQVAD